MYAQSFSDAGAYEFVCDDGHKNVVMLQSLRFEVLAEVGVQAIVDGYYRDAISSFAASLERFHEFYLEVVSTSQGAKGAFDETWKNMSKQSERQLGAFMAMYLAENGQVAPLLSQKHTEFRNRVIHQGSIPTEAQAVVFGQAVLDLMHELWLSMRGRYSEAVSTIVVRRLAEMRSKFAHDQPVSTMCSGCIFDLAVANPQKVNLPFEIKRRRHRLATGRNLIAASDFKTGAA